MNLPKLVITGASGFLGYHLLKEAAGKFEIHGLYFNHEVLSDPIKNVASFHRVDLTDFNATGDLLDDIAPDFIVHTAAIADANYCQLNEQESREINVEATALLAGIACDFQVPFVFTSTDLVFDGTKGNYSESDPPNPLMRYGEQKFHAESEALQIYPNALVARLPLLFGEINAGTGSPFSNMINDLKQGKSVSLFYDEFRSMCNASIVAKGILQLMGKADGVLHLCSNERVSRYDFGLKTAAALGLDDSLITKVSQNDFTFSAARPKDVSMNCGKAMSLGFKVPSIEDQLQQLKGIV